MTITTPSAQPFSTDKHINAAAKGITASEKKLLVSVNDEIERLNQIAGSYQPERLGQGHPLDAQIALAEHALAEDPTAEAALELHNLIVRKEQTKLSTTAVSGAIGRKVSTVIDTLIPVAVSILDKAESDFLAEAAAHREATKTQTSFATATADFDARLDASIEAFKAKRKWITEENASAHFLLLELGLLA
ncbi:hypothetical protein HQ447_08560 [bacterium]|nr:hypothetical protein [bacterium]